MRVIAVIFFLPILALAQGSTLVSSSENPVAYYLSAYSRAEDGLPASTADVEDFITRIAAKRESFKTEKAFLSYVFRKTHQRFLKHYEEYATFNALLKSKTYNCLSGTALYALVLKRVGVPYSIIETNYHIFLIAKTDTGNVLFEATDPMKGFVSSGHEIEARIQTYKQNTLLQASTDKMHYRFKADVYNQIDLDGITGLLHYNLAVQAFNRQDLPSTIFHLDKTVGLYQSSRIDEFSKIVLLSVIESKLDNSVKENCLRKIQSIRKHKMPVVASSKSFNYQ